eukprot:SAG11_NODE_6784_length_1249_cov_2.544348_1_plen_84_part_10
MVTIIMRLVWSTQPIPTTQAVLRESITPHQYAKVHLLDVRIFERRCCDDAFAGHHHVPSPASLAVSIRLEIAAAEDQFERLPSR